MQVDYDALAARYDRHRRGGGPFLPTLLRLAATCPGNRVLEIGAGTGNNTGAFLAVRPSWLIGLDASMGMLTQARHKNLNAHWVRGFGDSLPLRDDAVGLVFAICVLHHIPDLVRLFSECRRVLMPGGIAAFVTAPHDFIARHPMNRYFPSFAAIDTARFQDVPDVVAAMNEAGFLDPDTVRDVAEAKPLDWAYYERVAGRFISTFDLIPEAEFELGLARFRDDLNAGALERATLAWECDTVWGKV